MSNESNENLKKCPYCGSTNLNQASEKETSCRDCGMGKYTTGKR